MATKKLDTRNKALIEKSRSKKQPFKCSFIGRNGQQIGQAETFTTKRNAEKNILAHLNFFGGADVNVIDLTGKEPVKYLLMKDGYKDTKDKSVDIG